MFRYVRCLCFFLHPLQGRFRPAKLQIMPDEPQTLEAELGPLLSPALKAAAFSKVRAQALLPFSCLPPELLGRRNLRQSVRGKHATCAEPVRNNMRVTGLQEALRGGGHDYAVAAHQL